MAGLFTTFNVAKRGINVQQQAINVTSHNISNAGTIGYSRQRVKVETTRPMTVYGSGAGQIGTGAQVEAIERVRDSFLDFQIRGESSTLGKYDSKAQFLSEVETVFNEPSDTGISTLIGKFFDSFQELSKQPNSSNTRTVVAEQTAGLCQGINATYNGLEKLQTNAKEQIKTSVTDVNSLLSQIDKLNQEIIKVTVAGNTPNDLMDSRDLLVDELSYKMNIVVDKKANNGIEIRPVDVGNMRVPELVSSDPSAEVSRFSYISSIEKPESQADGTYVITYYKMGDMDSEENKQTVTVTGLSDKNVKELLQSRMLWANEEGQLVKADGHPVKNGDVINAGQLMNFTPSEGEIAGVIEVQSDIQDYMDQLDRLAKGIALSVNAVHSGITDPFNPSSSLQRDFLPFFVNGDVAKYDSEGVLINLDETLAAEVNISAKNISINHEILNDVMKIKTKSNDYLYAYTDENIIDGEGDGKRALAIAQLKERIFRIQDINSTIITRSDMFNESIGGNSLGDDYMTVKNSIGGMNVESYFKDTIDRLGVRSLEAQRMVSNQEELLYSLEESKLSVSGVSLDEEMANLVQFQHAYNANAKIIATLDELLDVVVNGLKR